MLSRCLLFLDPSMEEKFIRNFAESFILWIKYLALIWSVFFICDSLSLMIYVFLNSQGDQMFIILILDFILLLCFAFSYGIFKVFPKTRNSKFSVLPFCLIIILWNEAAFAAQNKTVILQWYEVLFWD
jgi:hypothetical protein